ncbi:CHAD domain-containing protein [Calothrix sp. UHCC 0171]|uniref:CHAD domain-containing protein n=1 Tax=Calothrix sp. UHCC 0171 TaxID=3110245 RepID=UPI002B213AE7|nr:CHAD domain-containing protein [Calothrix sp. UHCC 0171]MEA5571495.1 CHAD domain-containing protein [Calothrix sp. UHCC 0171]
MTLATTPIINNLGDYTYQAIQKHFKKILKWEKSVKKDEDPEALHQMRVGMRRLRTVVSSFSFVLSLPKSVSDRNIGKIARKLGELRDLDVLKENIEANFQASLPSPELKYLQKVFDVFHEQRENVAVNVTKTLKDVAYKSLKSSLNDWLAEPSYQESATLVIELVLPDLLLPEVSAFLLHPGWQFGSSWHQNISIDKSSKLSELHNSIKYNLLAGNNEVLHSLRKQAKRLRYQMELFVDFYDETYAGYLAEVKNIQEILGEIHDIDVLEEWFVDIFGKEFSEKLPTFVNLLAEKRQQLWQEWQPLQTRYLQLETRQQLHLAILHPMRSPDIMSS